MSKRRHLDRSAHPASVDVPLEGPADLPEQNQTERSQIGSTGRAAATVSITAIVAGTALGLTGHTAVAMALATAASSGVTVTVNVRRR